MCGSMAVLPPPILQLLNQHLATLRDSLLGSDGEEEDRADDVHSEVRNEVLTFDTLWRTLGRKPITLVES